jgi:hypothetical protein
MMLSIRCCHFSGEEDSGDDFEEDEEEEKVGFRFVRFEGGFAAQTSRNERLEKDRLQACEDVAGKRKFFREARDAWALEKGRGLAPGIFWDVSGHGWRKHVCNL